MSNAQAYIAKCLELSERCNDAPWKWDMRPPSLDIGAITDSKGWVLFETVNVTHFDQHNCEFVAHARTALPKVCEALKIALDELDHHCYCPPTQQRIGTQCHVCNQIDKINAVSDGADGG